MIQIINLEESENLKMIKFDFSVYLNANVLKSKAISWHKQNMICYPMVQVANICDAIYIDHSLFQQNLSLQFAEIPI